jgi:hypothetical protein
MKDRNYDELSGVGNMRAGGLTRRTVYRQQGNTQQSSLPSDDAGTGGPRQR